MEPDRERVYNDAVRQPAQNLDTRYRSRWAVNAIGGQRRTRAARGPGQGAPDRGHVARSAPAPSGDLGLDLTPLMRLAQEACWSRLFNRPRRPCRAEL